MAKKIDAATAARLKSLGIKAKDEDEARKKLLKILAENDIDGMEEEDTDSLLDMAESMVDPEETEMTEEEENDALAEEVGEEEGDEDEEEEEDDEEEDDEEEDDEEEDDEEEDEEPEEKPAKKTAVKTAGKKAEKKVEEPKKAAKAAPKAEKKETEKKAAKPAKVGKRGMKLDPKNNKDDRKAFAFLEKFFPADEYEYCWIVMNGVTIKHKGQNSSRAIIGIEACTQMPDGSVTGTLILMPFVKKTDILDEKGIDWKPCWNGTPQIKGMTFEEMGETIESLLEHMTNFVEKVDKRLGDNRKKMEKSLSKHAVDEAEEKAAKKAAAKKVTKKAEVVDEDDDEEEDDEPQKPAKKAVKKAKK